MRLAIRIAVALSFLSVLGCEKKAKKEEVPSAKPSPSEKVELDTSKPAETGALVSTPQKPPEVKLLSPGAEPRKELRLSPKAGDKQTMVMVMKTAMEMSVGGTANPPVKLPAMRMTMEMSVKSVTPDGDIHYEFILNDAEVMDEPGVLPQVASAMKTALSSAKGMSGAGVMSNRGFNKGTTINVPPGADAQLRQLLEGMKDSFNQIAAPLPAEPVGNGAKWEVKMLLQQQGMQLEQTATYDLVSMKGAQVTAKSTVAQSAANQKITNPSMPSLKMDLVKLQANGTGDVTFDLGRLVPPAATGDIHSEASMAMDMGGQKQTMSMKMDVNVQVTGK
jgi:hypothetical protein